MTVGGTETLAATVTPSNVTNKAVTWSSSNTFVATVSNGVVRPSGWNGEHHSNNRRWQQNSGLRCYCDKRPSHYLHCRFQQQWRYCCRQSGRGA